jgi:5'-3' exonuclease
VIDGDRSDSIPGVKGVGTKSLIKEYPELSENKPFDIKTLLDAAKQKSTRISNMIVENELVIKRNYLLMQLKEPNINNHAKLRITDAIRDLKPQIVKYNLQKLLVQDKLWGQIPNFDNWVTEFMELNHYWNNK